MHRVSAGDTAMLMRLLDELQASGRGQGTPSPIAVCFEAGRDGFWLHRLLTAQGITAYVVEPTSILVNRRAKRAKTDRLDAEGMLRVLAAYIAGDTQICSMVQVPTPDEEDGKGCTGSENILCRSERGSKIAYLLSLSPKVSVRGHHCVAGSETWRSLRPAMDASFPNILHRS